MRCLAMLAPLLLPLLTGCDPHYLVHMHARVPSGAWVVPLDYPQAARRADVSGRAELVYGGFLGRATSSPVLVHAPGYKPWALAPRRDFALRARGLFFVRAWDADLVVAPVLADPASGPPLVCTDNRCEAVLPTFASGVERCSAYLVRLSAERVEGTGRPEPCEPAGPSGFHCAATLPVPPAAGEMLMVSTCSSQWNLERFTVIEQPQRR